MSKKKLIKGNQIYINILQLVADVQDVIVAKEFSKTGCTKSLRAKLWAQILNINVENQVSLIFQNKIIQFIKCNDRFISKRTLFITII